MASYCKQIQTRALYSRDKVEILRRRWLLPSIEFHGIEKSFDKSGAPTLIPNSVSLLVESSKLTEFSSFLTTGNETLFKLFYIPVV